MTRINLAAPNQATACHFKKVLQSRIIRGYMIWIMSYNFISVENNKYHYNVRTNYFVTTCNIYIKRDKNYFIIYIILNILKF